MALSLSLLEDEWALHLSGAGKQTIAQVTGAPRGEKSIDTYTGDRYQRSMLVAAWLRSDMGSRGVTTGHGGSVAR